MTLVPYAEIRFQVGNQKNLIELNGQKYDTITGKVLTSNTPKKSVQSSTVEGFVSSHPNPHHKAASAHGVHQKASRSKTLMRGAVHRPAITALHDTIDHIAQVQSNTHVVADHKRSLRAKNVSKSSLVNRFHRGDMSGTIKAKPAVLAVKPAPEASVPKTVPAVAHAPTHKEPFSKALEQAQSHTQPKAPKQKLHHRVARKLHLKPRTLNIVASTAVIVLLVGFFGYQYRAYASVRIAATRASVAATLPSYHPAGFSLSDRVQYRPGEVSLAYTSNSDRRNFSVTQSTSDWNSEALAENLTNQHIQYLRQEDKGKTIFFYNQGDATWVNGGIWYQVKGNSALNSDQLLRIADSI